MHWFFFVLLAFLCGSIPFSVWLGRLLWGQDVRRVGDGNPGATNVFRAGHKLTGLLALILDISKAAAPVGWAYYQLGIRGLPMVLIALAPILGHALSPFLGFRGGKALATALGTWIGLTLWKASLAGVTGAVIGLAITPIPGWAVLFGLAAILITLLVWMPDPLLLLVWAGVAIILLWTHRTDLRYRPMLRPWIVKMVR